MRILFWTELFWPYIGGAEVFSADLIPALQDRGYEFTIVTSHNYLDLPDEEEYMGVKVTRFPFREALKNGDIDLFARIRNHVVGLKKAFKPDLVHINGVQPSVMPKTWVFWDKEQALGWALQTSYPKVFKLSVGVKGSNVILVRSSQEAHLLIKQMFGPGIVEGQLNKHSKGIFPWIRHQLRDKARRLKHGSKFIYVGQMHHFREGAGV